MKKFVAMMLVFGVVMLSGCDALVTSGVGSSTDETAGTPSTSESKEEVLFENEVVKVTFMEIFEMDGIAGACYLKLKVENKSDKTVTVYLKDAYVNDTAVLMGSGVPMTLAPGKNSQAPFFFSYTNLDIDSKDEVKKIEFKMFLTGENSETVLETESLIVEFNN